MRNLKPVVLFLGMALCFTACGEKNKKEETKPHQVKPMDVKPQDATTDKGQDSRTDADTDNIPICPTGKGGKNCDECLLGFFGKDCQPCTCSEHGACNDGKDGDGLCSDCDSGFWGLNCQNECACEDDEQHFCLDGIDGMGCICEGNFVGDDCDIPIKCNSQHGELDPSNGHCKKDSCQAGWTGTDCDIEVKCAHGEIDTTSGHCKANSCQTGWDGDDCDECAAAFTGTNCDQCKNSRMTGNNCDKEILCQHGTLDTQSGHCSANSCETGWDGEDCDECASAFTGANCDECDTTKGYGANCTVYGSVTIQEHSYKTAIINSKEWMAENMKSTKGNDNSTLTCYANTSADSNFVKNYGCLYTWADAMKVCPSGWHLPTETELNALLNYVYFDHNYNDFIVSENLRASSWESGADKYGFGALPAGFYNDGSYLTFGSSA